jgi:isopentenyl-diphosphate delta-isomerase
MSFMKEYVILIDEKDVAIGQEEKLLTHRQGLLHRAFSIFIFNRDKQLLLQKRADVKYHSPGLWSNTCCGHPRPEESLEKATARRLFEEMGIKCPLYYAGKFTYRTEFSNMNLIEHEIDHLFYGFFDDLFIPNNNEVSLTRWISRQELLLEIRQTPHSFTAWFEQALQAINSSRNASSRF